MATSGSKSVKVTDWDTLKFSWSEKSQSIANNTTTISWTLQLIATDYGYISSSASKAWSVTVNGTKYSGTTTVGINNNSTKTLASGTTTITHNSDGTKTFDYSFSQVFDITFNGWVGTVSGSGSGTLDTIPRKSTLSVGNGTLGTAQTLTVTRQSSSFTHTITYTATGEPGSYTAIVQNSSSTSISWTPPLSLSSYNTTGTSIKITIVLTTLNGENVVGIDQKTVTYTIPSSVKPSCSMTLEDVTGIDDIYGSPVQNLSKIKVTINPTIAYGSPIASYTITIDGTQYTKAEVTTGTLRFSGNSYVVVSVKDKRGRSATASYTMKVQAYAPPSVPLLSVHRCDASGKEDDQGEYISAKFSAVISPLSNKNTAAYTLKYKKSTDSEYTIVELEGYEGSYELNGVSYVFAADSNNSYDVEVTATDAHKSTARATSASTAFSLIDFHSSGNAIRFGGVAEEQNTFQNDLHLVQRGNTYCFSSIGADTTDGFILMARITVTATNSDSPMTFVFSRRQSAAPMTVHVRFNSTDNKDPGLASISYEGENYGAYLSSPAASVWDLYVQKVNQSDTVTLNTWHTSYRQMKCADVEFIGSIASAVPTGRHGYYRATPLVTRSILDCFFPVGFVLTLYSHADPNEMYPGSTWVRITNAFLWATTSGGTIGQTGGEQTHVLTANELPSHRHSVTVASTNTGSTTVGDTIRYNGSATNYKGTLYTENTGGGVAHNNMPPYIQVSMWRRTA